MIELHLSLSCSEYFRTTATIKVGAGLAIALFASAARLLVHVAASNLH